MINDINDTRLYGLGISSSADGYITNAYYLHGALGFFVPLFSNIGNLELSYQGLMFNLRDESPVFALSLRDIKVSSLLFGTIILIQGRDHTYWLQPAGVGGAGSSTGPAAGRRFIKYIRQYQKEINI
jgi:hypothetical protein